jgi:hypothetical protein
MRTVLLLLAAAGLAACDDLRGLVGGGSSASLVSSSGGEVALADGGSLEFAITSEQYKRWDRARRGIDRRIAARFGEILQPDAPTERSIAEAVSYLEGEPAARSSIEKAGMSVRGFVVMTVALEQEMRVASGQPRVRQPEPTPSPYDFPQFDTTLIQPPVPQPYPTPTPEPAPADSYRVDTAFPIVPHDTMRRIIVPPAMPRRDTLSRQRPTIFRRDTVIRRDTVRVDTVQPPPPPVGPDTLGAQSPGAIIPPDTLRRA